MKSIGKLGINDTGGSRLDIKNLRARKHYFVAAFVEVSRAMSLFAMIICNRKQTFLNLL